MMFCVYMDNWKNFKDCFILVTPQTPEAHFLFCRVPERECIPTGAPVSMPVKFKENININGSRTILVMSRTTMSSI